MLLQASLIISPHLLLFRGLIGISVGAEMVLCLLLLLLQFLLLREGAFTIDDYIPCTMRWAELSAEPFRLLALQ